MMHYFFVSWLQNLSGRLYPFDIVMCLVSTVPLTQETRKFSIPELQSKQKCNDFHVCTDVPLVWVVLYVLQYIAIITFFNSKCMCNRNGR